MVTLDCRDKENFRPEDDTTQIVGGPAQPCQDQTLPCRDYYHQNPWIVSRQPDSLQILQPRHQQLAQGGIGDCGDTEPLIAITVKRTSSFIFFSSSLSTALQPPCYNSGWLQVRAFQYSTFRSQFLLLTI